MSTVILPLDIIVQQLQYPACTQRKRMLAYAPMTIPVYSKLTRNLVCHPQTPPGSIKGIDVQIASTADDKLILSYMLKGDLDTIMIPPERPGEQSEKQSQGEGEADELWQHTCFEAFLMRDDGPGYREYNFSPSGEWAAYAFHDYRQATITPDKPMPVIRVQRTAQHLELEAEISIALLPQGQKSSDRWIRLGLSAVVETLDGSKSYWALRHPPGKPDFHHLNAFDIQLDWP